MNDIITSCNNEMTIEFIGISRTIEILNDKLKQEESYSYSSSIDMKEIVDCIIKLDEQLKKHEDKESMKCIVKGGK